MKDTMYGLIGVILIGLLCVTGYYAALRELTKFKADIAWFSAILPWLAGSMATIAIIVVIYTLGHVTYSRWVTWRKS